jgi:uncharacterized membrane protein YqjE
MKSASAPAAEGRPGGVIGDGLRLVGSLVRHLQALFALAGVEGRAAIGLYVRLLVMLLAALLFVTLGYVFLVVFIAFAVAALFGISWIWITLAIAVLHFGFAFVCASHVRNHFGTPVFPVTSAELQKDILALRKLDQTPT